MMLNGLGIACPNGQMYDYVLETCVPIGIKQPAGPALPVGYDPATGTVNAQNTIGQTVAGLPSSAPALCLAAGGTMDATTGLCLVPGSDNAAPAATPDMTYVYLGLGVVALIALLGVMK